MSSWIKKKERRKNLSSRQSSVLFPYIPAQAFWAFCTKSRAAFGIRRNTLFGRTWLFCVCVVCVCWIEGCNNFLLLGSGSLLLFSSSPSPPCLTLSPHFPPQSPLIFSRAELSVSVCMNAAEFHLNPQTRELWASEEEPRPLLFHI